MNKELEFLKSNDAIFHYTKKETAIEYILNNKELKFGFFKNTNDPYEYRERCVNICTAEVENEENSKDRPINIDNVIHNSLFLSFCTNSENSQNGYEKLRMWSQYGESHKGVCLVFSKEKLLENIKEKFSENYKIYDKKIDYELENIMPSIGESVLDYIENNLENIFFQKHIDYRDENEFRIVLVQKNGEIIKQELFIDISTSLEFIILGDKFPKIYLPIIEELSSKLDVGYKKLKWEDNQYYLINCKNG